MKIIQKLGRQETIIIGSLHPPYNPLIRRLDPTIPTFASWNDVGRVMLLFVTGLLPYASVPFESLSAPYVTRDFYRMKLNEASKKETLTARCGMYAFLSVLQMLQLVSDTLFDHLNKRGVLTNVWVLNDPDEIQLAMNTKVGGIMTDRPAFMKSMI